MAVETQDTLFGNEVSAQDASLYRSAGFLPNMLIGGTGSRVNYTPEQVQVNQGSTSFGDSENNYRTMLGRNAQTAQGREAAQGSAAQLGPAAQIDIRNQQVGRGYQNQLLQALAQQSRGQGPSLADMQMKQGMESNLAAIRANAASSRGGYGARQGSMTQALASANTQAANQAMMGRLAEQQQAQQMLGALSGQMRGQDIGLATSQAGLNQQQMMQQGQMDQQMALANLQAQMQQRGMNDSQQQAMINALLGMEGQIQQGNVALEQARIQAEAQERANAMQAALANQKSPEAGGLLGGIGGLLG